MDENGDLGISRRSSSFFIIAATITNDPLVFRRIPKKARRKFSRRFELSSELKHSSAPEEVSQWVLKNVSPTDCRIYWIGIEKEKMIRNNRYLDRLLIFQKLFLEMMKMERSNGYVVIFDRYSKKVIDLGRFHRSIQGSLGRGIVRIEAPIVKITLSDSMSEPALQVQDFVVGSIFRSLERNDDTHLDIIKDKIVFGRIVTMKDLSIGIWKD